MMRDNMPSKIPRMINNRPLPSAVDKVIPLPFIIKKSTGKLILTGTEACRGGIPESLATTIRWTTVELRADGSEKTTSPLSWTLNALDSDPFNWRVTRSAASPSSTWMCPMTEPTGKADSLTMNSYSANSKRGSQSLTSRTVTSTVAVSFCPWIFNQNLVNQTGKN